MARKKVEKESKSLDKLIPQFAEHKADADALKKICDTENAEIKKLMGNKNGTYEAGGYKASISVTDIETVDEELLCTKLAKHEDAYTLGIIKVKEYVDSKALESAIYKKELSAEILKDIDSCRSSKPRVTLRVTKIKEGEDD